MSNATSSPGRWRAYALVAPALAVIALFFVFPLVLSAVLAFRNTGGGFTWEHFAKAWDLYQKDLIFTVGIVLLSTVLIGVVAVAIAGYLTLGENRRALLPNGRYVMIGGAKGRWIQPMDRVAAMAAYSPFVSQQFGMMLAKMNKSSPTCCNAERSDR